MGTLYLNIHFTILVGRSDVLPGRTTITQAKNCFHGLFLCECLVCLYFNFLFVFSWFTHPFSNQNLTFLSHHNLFSTPDSFYFISKHKVSSYFNTLLLLTMQYSCNKSWAITTTLICLWYSHMIFHIYFFRIFTSELRTGYKWT